MSQRFNILRPNVFKDQSYVAVLIAMKVSSIAFDVVSRICDFVLVFKLISVLATLARASFTSIVL